MLTKQAYWIAYDITDNRFRTQIADRLVAMGLERIQLSVFAGNVKVKKIKDFSLWFQKENATFAFAEKNSLIMLNGSIHQLGPIQVFGQKFIDIEMLTDNKLTLIIGCKLIFLSQLFDCPILFGIFQSCFQKKRT